MASTKYPHRFTHDPTITQKTDPKTYQLGKKQAQCALERYHYLCAAVQKLYNIETVPGDFSKGQLFPRQVLSFRAYKDYALDNVEGVKLHPRQDGTIHPGDIEVYKDGFFHDWNCREGGIMYCLGDSRPWWNMILNYHSSSGTTGVKSWNRLFKTLKENHFDKSLVPCMFFAREAGCCDPQCPFLHHREACERDREKVLMKRRATLGRPTMRDISLLQKRQLRGRTQNQLDVSSLSSPNGLIAAVDGLLLDDVAEMDDSEDDVDPEVQRIFDDSAKIRRICSNPDCLTVMKMKKQKANDPTTQNGENSAVPSMKTMTCARCKVAYYCSKDCQKADWKRHKAEPCLPFEELVEKDDVWDRSGCRKGTGHIIFESRMIRTKSLCSARIIVRGVYI